MNAYPREISTSNWHAPDSMQIREGLKPLKKIGSTPTLRKYSPRTHFCSCEMRREGKDQEDTPQMKDAGTKVETSSIPRPCHRCYGARPSRRHRGTALIRRTTQRRPSRERLDDPALQRPPEIPCLHIGSQLRLQACI